MTPRKKRICCTDEACSICKVCTNSLSRTVCSTSNHEMNSKENRLLLEVNSRSQITGILGCRATQRRSQGNQEETSRPRKPRKNTHPKRKLAGTVAHQSLLFPNQIFLLWYEEVVLNIFILCRELVTLFLTFKRQPIAKFLNASLLLLLKASFC